MARPMTVWKSVLFAVDVVNIACGYLSFLLLGWQTLKLTREVGFWRIVLFTPVYWMMMSVAAWRAVWQLWRNPHHWEKTPHRPMRRAAGRLVLQPHQCSPIISGSGGNWLSEVKVHAGSDDILVRTGAQACATARSRFHHRALPESGRTGEQHYREPITRVLVSALHSQSRP